LESAPSYPSSAPPPSSDGSFLAAALSTHVVKVYARGKGGSVGALLELTGHGGPITDAHFPLPEEPALVLTSSEDGTVRLWDCRAPLASREAHKFTAHFAKTFATATMGGGGDHLVAAGSGAQIAFWDRRTGAGMEVFEEAHSEDVTRLRFQPGRRSRLFTASVDGLACVFDCSGAPSDLNDEDGLLAVMATGSAIVEMGFCAAPGGSASDVLWALTGNEEAWMFDASRGEALGTQLAHVPDTRAAAARAATAAGCGTGGLGEQVDYLVTCFADPASGAVLVAAGTQAGTIGVFPVMPGPGEPSAVGAGAALGPPVMVLVGGHTDIVRAMAWSPGGGGSASAHPVTGAEDSRVCVWGETAGAEGLAGGKAGWMGEAWRHSPY